HTVFFRRDWGPLLLVEFRRWRHKGSMQRSWVFCCRPGTAFVWRFRKVCFHPQKAPVRFWAGLIVLLCLQRAVAGDALDLQAPNPDEHSLYILSPNLLELFRVNTKQPDPAHVDSWDWVNSQGIFAPPSLSSIRVIVNGQTNNVADFGFKRRPIYAPLQPW